MSGEYPFGADCDTDAMQAGGLWSVFHDDDPEVEWIGLNFPSSPQCRGDSATGPGGGAPTSEQENGGAVPAAPPPQPSTPEETTHAD